MTKSKLLSVSVALAMLCFAVFAVILSVNAQAFAEEEVKVFDKAEYFTVDENHVLTAFNVPQDTTGKIKAVIPAGVTAIGDRAFAGRVTDPETSESEDTVLANLLAAVEMPDSVTSIGEYAFTYCANLAKVTLSQSLHTIGAAAFNNTAITDIVIPASVTRISAAAFENCVKLANVIFAKRSAEQSLEVGLNAFKDCTALTTVTLPDNTAISIRAFLGCAALQWAYLGADTQFVNSNVDANEQYFPRENTKIVFPDKAEYGKVNDAAFKNVHANQSTYKINVNCFIGDNVQPQVYTRLHGYGFNYVCGSTGIWSEDTSYNDLPKQASYYASTVWYGEKSLTDAVSYQQVNELLDGDTSEINLYCYQTIVQPAMPQKGNSWLVDEKVSYDAANLKDVLTALGCTNLKDIGDEQLAAMNFTVGFKDGEGKDAETPSAISQVGSYSVSVTLNPKYGVWTAPSASTATVNVDTAPFNVVLIVFLIVGILAVAVTVSTAIIRKNVQAKARKKKLSQQEVLDKFRAAGGETTLK